MRWEVTMIGDLAVSVVPRLAEVVGDGGHGRGLQPWYDSMDSTP